MLKLDFYRDKRQGNVNYGKYYARAKNAQSIGLDKLAEHMTHHNSPFSEGTMVGILTDMVDCIRELCLMGQPVRLDNLCIVSGQVTCTPADDAEHFDITDNVKSVRLRFTATGESTPASVKKEASLGYTSRAQKVRAGEITLSDRKGVYIDGETTTP